MDGWKEEIMDTEEGRLKGLLQLRDAFEMKVKNIRTNIHTYIHTYTHACKGLLQLRDAFVNEGEKHTYIHACVHTYIPCIHVKHISHILNTSFIHSYIHTYIHTYTYGVYTYVYIHSCEALKELGI